MKPKIHYIHRNKEAGYSIDKVTQTIIRDIPDKQESYLPYSGASIRSIFMNLLYCWRLRNKVQLFHVTGDVHYCILPLIGCHTVLTIHDTVLLDYYKYGSLKKLFFKWLWYKLPIRFADTVMCISEATYNSLTRLTSRTDIKIIYNAIDPLFQRIDKERINIPPKILIIGTNPNKNLERTICALKGIDCQLTIVGIPTERQLNLLAANQINFTLKNRLSDQQIAEEYAKTDIVSFISLYEGFGMIVIEANKVGRPLICSNISVLKEVAGNSALFVDPTDVEDIHQGFKRLVSDANLRNDLVNKGYENVKRFEVSRIRYQWLSLYSKDL